MYLDTLDRLPDTGGLLYWSGQLDRGVSPETVAQRLTHSSEYFGIVVEQAYENYLGRSADPAGLAYWTAQMGAGYTDEQLDAGFSSSPEFYQRAGGTDKAWVDALFQSLLGRQPDLAGLSYWFQVLNQGTSRDAVAHEFAASSEREGDIVSKDYQQYLHRTAGDDEVAYWVQALGQGLTHEDVQGAILGSAEYFQDVTGT
jgi:hypothetical protein